MLEVAVEESAVMETGELVFKDQTRRILPYVLKEINELSVLHLDGGLPRKNTARCP